MSRTPEQFKVTEEEILDVSLKHFSMHGYEGTNLNDIANELNITRTPIYYYFNNKLGLYESVTKRHLLSKKRSTPASSQAICLFLRRSARTFSYRRT